MTRAHHKSEGYIFAAAKKPSPAPVVDPKLTPEELAFLKEQQRLEMLAEKQKERDMLRKKWEDEKERKKKEKALVIILVFKKYKFPFLILNMLTHILLSVITI